MIYIGCHLSVTDGYEAMARTMTEFGGNTFAFFTRNPRGGRTRAVDPADIAAMTDRLESGGFGPLVAHGSYTMNLCSANPGTRANGLDMLTQDLIRMKMMPGQLYNFHPGAHTGQGMETGIEQIASGLEHAMKAADAAAGGSPADCGRVVLLETMAGKGSEIGGSFEELREIIDRIGDPACRERVGVCLDTCHVWDAGYDIAGDLDGVLSDFDRVIGLERLAAVHFNDSKNPLGSHKDRHEKLGQGCIGMEAMKRAALHPALQGLPFILETPNDDEGYIREIHTVMSWMQQCI